MPSIITDVRCIDGTLKNILRDVDCSTGSVGGESEEETGTSCTCSGQSGSGSGSSGNTKIPITCCPDGIPSVLTATVTGSTSPCECFDGLSWQITYDPEGSIGGSDGYWFGTFNTDCPGDTGAPSSFTMYCSDAQWFVRIGGPCSDADVLPEDQGTCDPFSVLFTFTPRCCLVGSISVVVTE